MRTAVPADDMMQAFAYKHLVPAEDLVRHVRGEDVHRRRPQLADRALVRPELVTTVDERLEALKPIERTGTATVTTFEDHTVRFTTDAVGVPHLVKVSYFPNWQADGADGVYRVAPSLMLVVPTEADVTLEFGRTWVEVFGMALTIVAVFGLATYGIVRVVKRRRAEV